MKKYWFQFERRYKDNFEYPAGVSLGCGVTAFDVQDAINILKENVFGGLVEMPKIIKVIEDVDFSSLDQGHVIPNMHPPIYRGVWFPKLG